ncbi:Glyoxalase/bleomycin resistance protein/dioxygenase [Acidobacteriia bacterium SbA2]|nr:Glyoxalase/bleomycin resistance protein/dioxygenase [Acidobacteriia bacterium SbA2]
MDDTGLRTSLVKFFARGTLSSLLALVAFGLLTALPALVSAGKPATHRPPIVGIAHIALKTDNLAGARDFYGRTLGFQEPFSVRVAKNSRSDLAGSPGDLIMTFFKVNDHQYIELTPDLTSPTEDRLSHIAFETTDIRALRDYLAANGLEVPATLKPGVAGNLSFAVKDPDGHTVEFVEYIEGSLHSRNFGKFLPDTRISQHMIHVGVTVRDRAAADHFYKDILGFQSIWYGGMTDDRVDWVDMRVPDGTDWLEYMLNVRDPSPRTLGVMHHFALGVPDIHAAYKEVMSRGYKAEEPKIGRDGKWQLNLYDPDYTRAELMEPKPVRKPCCSPVIGE